jgi:hypothetical protein
MLRDRTSISGSENQGWEGGGSWESLLNEYWVTFWRDEDVLELDSGDGCRR